jgi:hypothetical protein
LPSIELTYYFKRNKPKKWDSVLFLQNPMMEAAIATLTV